MNNWMEKEGPDCSLRVSFLFYGLLGGVMEFCEGVWTFKVSYGLLSGDMDFCRELWTFKGGRHPFGVQSS